MSPALGHFRSSATGGNIPTAATAAAVIMGRAAHPDDLAAGIGRAAAEGKATPVNWVAATTRVAPGGRALEEIDPNLLKGVKPYDPKPDMFGAPAA